VSTIIGVTTQRWVLAWVALEFNTLAICLIISKDVYRKKNKVKSIIKYFIIQTIASLALLISCIDRIERISMRLIVISLGTKIGIWPGHLWYARTLRDIKLSNRSILIIITWQKVLPMW
jgi:NADH:ubiquinone oxidoreductase subunit 2 (subunit N)